MFRIRTGHVQPGFTHLRHSRSTAGTDVRPGPLAGSTCIEKWSGMPVMLGRPYLRGNGPHDRFGADVSVSLTKGGNVSLTKEAPGLTNVVVGLGWDIRTTTGADFDLDASAIVLGADGKVLSDKHFVFFNNLTSPDGSVEHTGDNLTGEGEGDDEQVKVNLAGLPAEVDKVVFPVSIYDADSRSQSFGQVRNAFIRVVNAAGNAEIARYDLTEDASTETAMVFGEIYRNGADWKFRAVGQGYASGLAGIARDFGVNV
jgi:tellurium resistance protein TerD